MTIEVKAGNTSGVAAVEKLRITLFDDTRGQNWTIALPGTADIEKIQSVLFTKIGADEHTYGDLEHMGIILGIQDPNSTEVVLLPKANMKSLAARKAKIVYAIHPKTAISGILDNDEFQPSPPAAATATSAALPPASAAPTPAPAKAEIKTTPVAQPPIVASSSTPITTPVPASTTTSTNIGTKTAPAAAPSATAATPAVPATAAVTATAPKQESKEVFLPDFYVVTKNAAGVNIPPSIVQKVASNIMVSDLKTLILDAIFQGGNVERNKKNFPNVSKETADCIVLLNGEPMLSDIEVRELLEDEQGRSTDGSHMVSFIIRPKVALIEVTFPEIALTAGIETVGDLAKQWQDKNYNNPEIVKAYPDIKKYQVVVYWKGPNAENFEAFTEGDNTPIDILTAKKEFKCSFSFGLDKSRRYTPPKQEVKKSQGAIPAKKVENKPNRVTSFFSGLMGRIKGPASIETRTIKMLTKDGRELEFVQNKDDTVSKLLGILRSYSSGGVAGVPLLKEGEGFELICENQNAETTLKTLRFYPTDTVETILGLMQRGYTIRLLEHDPSNPKLPIQRLLPAVAALEVAVQVASVPAKAETKAHQTPAATATTSSNEAASSVAASTTTAAPVAATGSDSGSVAMGVTTSTSSVAVPAKAVARAASTPATISGGDIALAPGGSLRPEPGVETSKFTRELTERFTRGSSLVPTKAVAKATPPPAATGSGNNSAPVAGSPSSSGDSVTVGVTTSSSALMSESKAGKKGSFGRVAPAKGSGGSIGSSISPELAAKFSKLGTPAATENSPTGGTTGVASQLASAAGTSPTTVSTPSDTSSSSATAASTTTSAPTKAAPKVPIPSPTRPVVNTSAAMSTPGVGLHVPPVPRNTGATAAPAKIGATGTPPSKR